jgi:hypothetical protein
MLERYIHLWRRRSSVRELVVVRTAAPSIPLQSIPSERAARRLRGPRPWARSLRLMPGRRGTRS